MTLRKAIDSICILLAVIMLWRFIFYEPPAQGAYTDYEIEFIKQAVHTSNGIIYKVKNDSMLQLSNVLGYTRNLKKLNDTVYYDSTKVTFITNRK